MTSPQAQAPAPAYLSKQFESIAALGYVGWVTWLDQGGEQWAPVFESRAHQPKLVQVAAELVTPAEEAVRRPDRVTMDWMDLVRRPGLMQSVQLVAIFGYYGHWTEQPLAVVQRNSPGAWFLQYKGRGITLGVNDGRGQQRTGVAFWRLGYWEKEWAHPHTTLIEQTKDNREILSGLHPCWPKPHGFALNPELCGLKAEDVPPCPYVSVPLAPTAIAGG